MNTPFQDGYRFPAEWEPHEATWLTYPHSNNSFPGRLNRIYPPYMRFIAEIAAGEKVRINIPPAHIARFTQQLHHANIPPAQIEIFACESDDTWCRDHGPAFIIKDTPQRQKAIIQWNFNAWGGKYPHSADSLISGATAAHLPHLPVYRPGIIMEGGSVDFNGSGTVLTTTSCLLNPNRNPTLNRLQIERHLHDYCGIQQTIWLGNGIAGDDTDGHIDDIARFVSKHTIITVVEPNKNDINHYPLKTNLQTLQRIRLLNGRQPDIAELPMPAPLMHRNQRLPASYANFYITNQTVIAPVFRCKQDDTALQLLAQCFPHHRITPIDSTDIIRGLGSFHCLSQQEPV